jgi:carbonic anhydrase
MALVGATTFHGIAYAAALTRAQRDKLTPDDILALMKKGNKRFYTGKRKEPNLLAQQLPAPVIAFVCDRMSRRGPAPRSL